jgi:Protein of unknown function (DUF3052)
LRRRTARRASTEEDVVTSTADDAEVQRSLVAKLGMAAGTVVQEIGYDDDCDADLRAAVVAVTGSELVDDDYDDVVDVAMLWWRDEDGDLVDALVDAIGILADQGVIWLLTPKPGRGTSLLSTGSGAAWGCGCGPRVWWSCTATTPGCRAAPCTTPRLREPGRSSRTRARAARPWRT